ncbi:hypothetical protein GH714_022473 [Hevea brasiliensis]|uniref:YTH domain-containing family protein n=1 Tax=Hevea brasiliensis TaxID=3981 RepID=A0A6A6N5A1_HEVBR|nr:hypothetical protein GH714_022473 [Hevea brasiliensis]
MEYGCSVKEELGITLQRDQYNLPDLKMSSQTQSSVLSNLTIEDDNHKSIKYDVWASTPNGNNKLGAAFRDAERRSVIIFSNHNFRSMEVDNMLRWLGRDTQEFTSLERLDQFEEDEDQNALFHFSTDHDKEGKIKRAVHPI